MRSSKQAASVTLESLPLRGREIGCIIYKQTARLHSHILKNVYRNEASIDERRLYMYCAALMFVTSDLIAYITLEQMGISGTEDYSSESFKSFMKQLMTDDGLDQETFNAAAEDIGAYMQQLRGAFQANRHSQVVGGITRGLCDSFLANLIDSFNLPAKVGSESFNQTSNEVCNSWYATIGSLNK